MHTNNLIGTRIPAAKFDFLQNSREYVQDMAMLQHGRLNPIGQLYADDGDQGFVMMLNGKEVPFELSDIQRHDGDISYWELRVPRNVAHYNPELQGVKVVIFND